MLPHNITKLLLCITLFLTLWTFICCHSLPTEDINKKLLRTVKTFMNPGKDPCEDFFQYACGNWENANEDNYKLLDNINYLDYTYNQKIIQILNRTMDVNEFATDTIYGRARDYYESCEAVDYVNYTKYLEIIKPMSGEEWPADGELWNPKSEWNIWSTVGQLAAVGFNGFFFAVDYNQHNATSFYVYIEQIESYSAELFAASSKISNEDKNSSAIAEKVHKFIEKLEKLNKHKPSEETKYEIYSLNTLQKQVEEIDFFAFFSSLLGLEDLGEIQIKVKNINHLKQLAELISQTSHDVLIHSLKISFINYLQTQAPSKYEWFKSCVAQMRNLIPLALNYIYEKQIYQFQRPTSDPVIKNVFQKMQQKLVEIFQGLSAHYSSAEIEFLKQKILKMKLNIGDLPQGVENNFYTDYLSEWQVTKGDYYSNHVSALKHRTSRDYEQVTQSSPWPANTFITMDGASPEYSGFKNYVFIPFAYLNYPAFDSGFSELFLFAEMGNSVGHEMMHAFDTYSITRDGDGNPSQSINITNSTKYSNGLKCLRQTKTDNVNEKLADFSGFRLAYDSYFQQPNIPKFVEGETGLTSKQLFFIKFAQFFCSVGPNRVVYDKSHDTPYHRVREVVANNPEFEEVFSCPQKTGESFVEKCRQW